MAEIRCSYCGWRNEAQARVCGGCGRPLRASGGPRFASRTGSRGPAPAGWYGSAGDGRSGANLGYDADERTVSDYAPVRPDTRTVPARQGWPGAGVARTRPHSIAPRMLLAGLVLAAAFAVLAAGIWSAGVRPQLHQQADGALRTQLAAMVTTINQLPVIPSTNIPVTAAVATATLQQDVPNSVPLKNLQVDFSEGRVVVSFTAYGFDGTASTALGVRSGRLVASGTEVDGPMALIETGSELETTINDALAQLRHDITIKQITLQNDVLTVSVKGTV